MWYRFLLQSSREAAFPFTASTPSQTYTITGEQAADFYGNMVASMYLSKYVPFLVLLTETICLMYLLDHFLEPRLKERRWMVWMTGIGYFAAVRMTVPYNDILETLFHFLILVFFVGFLYRGTAGKKGYLIVTFWALVSLCGSLEFYVGKITKMRNYGLWYFPDIVIKKFSYWPFDHNPYKPGMGYELVLDTGSSFSLMLTCIILALVTRKLVKGMRYSLDVIHKKELLFLLMPSFTGFIVYLILEMEKKFLLFQVAVDWATEYGIVLHLLTPLLIVTTMLCILYAYDIYQQLLEYVEEKGRAVILEQEMGQMQNHIGEIEQLYTGIRSVKHDMQNYLFDIKSLLAAQGINVEEGESELGGYLAGIGTSLDAFSYSLHTGNPVTDVVLNGKLKQAQAAGIEYGCSFLFPAGYGISAFDISIILNNAVNNALEACQKLKMKEQDAAPQIEITSHCRNNMFFIIIRNSFDGILNENPGGLSPATRKDNPVWHGLGFQNIRKCAEKYLGSADYEVMDNRFILTVMLQKQELSSGREPE